MANVLKMAIVESILSLYAQGWAQRRIARELGIDRSTVRKYLLQHLSGAKPANAPTGSGEAKPATLTGSPAPGLKPASAPIGTELSKPANAPTGPGTGSLISVGAIRSGAPSQCEPYREVILAKVNEGLTARRIHQDLVAEGATIHYDAVRRFIRRTLRLRQLPFRRMESAPGEEAQVDFGSGAPVITPEGKRRKCHVFRIVLSYSRKAYSEATHTQTTDDFLRCLENAFAHFGGVPKTLVIDNLKAAVAHPEWFDPVLTPKVQSFCQHYGTVILPTRVYMPRHKGKVERGVAYVKGNALKGRKFSSLEEQNRFLTEWERTVADTRIHGTTKRQVLQLFADEQSKLRALPQERFANFKEAQRKVNRDGHIEVARAYYSVPPEYLGREVWVRWDGRLVRIFNHRFEQIALHVRHEAGRFSTLGEHIAREKISGIERGAAYLLSRVRIIGQYTQQWAESMLHTRGIEGTRVLQGLLSLTKKHSAESLEKACETALSHGAFRLKTIRILLSRAAAKQQPLAFIDEHPIIRPLDDYAAVVAAAVQRQADRSSMSEGFGRHDSAKASCGDVALTKQPDDVSRQAALVTDLLPPRSEYSSPSCSSAELGSASSDSSTVITPPDDDKEQSL